MDEFRLLGPLEAVVDGKRVLLGAAKPRALLALLLLNRNRVVSTERLVDELWGDEAPARATKALQVYISQLRKALGPERLVTRPPGYELLVGEGELDVERFESLAAAAREQLEAGNPKAAAAGLRDALELWRGPALREFRSEPFAELAAGQLEDLRLGAVEDRMQAELDSGGTARLIPQLEELVAAQPFRDRPRELLMLALYRSGRQADALDLYRRTRELFVQELGIEPGPTLRELEGAMLRQDPTLAAPRRRPRPAAPPADGAPRPRRWLPLVAALAAVLVAAGVAAALLLPGGGHHAPAAHGNPKLRAFVFKLEFFLSQSRSGRDDVKRAIRGALDCKLPPQAAARRLDRVQRNRQSLLQQLAALNVPSGEAPLRTSDRLQKAIGASIAVDGLYQDWLRTRTRCPRGERLPADVRTVDARATRLKRRFLAAFNPLARRFGQRVWKVDEF